MKCEYGAMVKQTIRGENRSTRRSACHNSTYATANQKWIGLWSNPNTAVTDSQITTWDTVRP